MLIRTSLFCLLICSLFSFSPGASASDKFPGVSVEGLTLVEKDHSGEIYSDPDVDWNSYTQIKLDRATVAFRKNWRRDQNRDYPFKVDAADMEKIKSEMADLFDEVFKEELSSDGGYAITTETGDNVMRIEPKIVDLDVYAPDTSSTPGVTRSYTETTGRMTLKLFIYDSVTGDLISAASDQREAPRRGYMQWTTSVTNRAEARRMLKSWAKGLRERLDEASGR